MSKYFFILLFLCGCTGQANNRIGYGVPLGKDVSIRCVETAIQSIKGLSEFKPQATGYFFKLNKYKINLIYSAELPAITRYDIDIDGMLLGENTGEFYRNAQNISELVKESISNACK